MKATPGRPTAEATMRYSLLLLGLIALPLLGCTDPKLDAREDRKICVREGFEPGTIEYDKCMKQEAI
jgi:hypothetical protein